MWFVLIINYHIHDRVSFMLTNDVNYEEAYALIMQAYPNYAIIELVAAYGWIGEKEL